MKPDPNQMASSSDSDALRRFRLRSGRSKLRTDVARLISIINKPLADVIRDNALHFLPPQSLRRLRSVSASWNTHISSPIFALTHSYSRQSPSGIFSPLSSSSSKSIFFPNRPTRSLFTPFDATSDSIPDPTLSFLHHSRLSVKSSSNGLVLAFLNDRDYVVCNPVTAEWVPLPKPTINHGENPNAVLIFNPSVMNCGSEFFVVAAFEIDSGIFGFDVYSSATGKWEASEEICCEEEMVVGSGISACGVAVWRTSMQTVVVFDPTVGVASTVAWPMGYSVGVTWQLAVVMGRICCVVVDGEYLSVFALGAGDYTWGPRRDYLRLVMVEEGNRMWKWVNGEDEWWEEVDVKLEEKGEVLMGGLRPLRSQSGNLEVVVVIDGTVYVLDLAGRRVKHVCDLPVVAMLEEELVLHTNTLADVHPKDDNRLAMSKSKLIAALDPQDKCMQAQGKLVVTREGGSLSAVDRLAAEKPNAVAAVKPMDSYIKAQLKLGATWKDSLLPHGTSQGKGELHDD